MIETENKVARIANKRFHAQWILIVDKITIFVTVLVCYATKRGEERRGEVGQSSFPCT